FPTIFIANSSPDGREEKCRDKSNSKNPSRPILHIFCRKVSDSFDVQRNKWHNHRHTASNEKVSKPHDNYITFDCGCIVVDKVTLLSRYCSLALIWESQAYPFPGYIVNLSIAFINNRRNISALDRKSTGSEIQCKENYYLSIGLSL